MTIAEVHLWGTMIGAARWDPDAELGHFEYTHEFLPSGIQVAPLTMPLSRDVHSFPSLARESFHGLPGLLSDSLPDRFGNALIDASLAEEGRTPAELDPVARLCYVGKRGMGALEFEPTLGPSPTESERLRVDELVELASEILTRRGALAGSFESAKRRAALENILRVGTSAGGARAKAIVAWNPTTNEVRSGQVPAGQGFSYWLLKFDGVSGNRDKELEDPAGYGVIEYAYHRMAVAAGVEMTECRILEENDRHHFMTRRFDRPPDGGKLHMLSLGAIAHLDYNQPGAHSYEQALMTIHRLGLSRAAQEQQFLRMVFNIVARNQDDHVKNIAFLMNKRGEWSLAPAFDVTYSYNPDGRWTNAHQMTLNGKRDGFERGDLERCAKAIALPRGRAGRILERVTKAVREWPRYAEVAGVPDDTSRAIGRTHRLSL